MEILKKKKKSMKKYKPLSFDFSGNEEVICGRPAREDDGVDVFGPFLSLETAFSKRFGPTTPLLTFDFFIGVAL